MDLHPIRLVEFDQALITGHIGWKFIEITLYPCLVELGISVNSTGIYLNGFTPNSTGRMPLTGNVISMDLHPIRLGINYWSNWVEIHWDYTIISMKNKYKVTQYIWSRFGQQIDRFY